MDFTFTDEQVQLRDSVTGWLGRHYGFEARRAIVDGDAGWSAEVWRGFGELGLLGLADRAVAPDPVDLMVAVEALGEALAVEPFVETVVTGASLLRAAGGERAGASLRGIVAGEVRLALAWQEPTVRNGFEARTTVARRVDGGWRLSGDKAVVTGAPWATTLLVTAASEAGTSIFLVDPAAAGVTLNSYPTIDGRRAADIRLDDVALPADALLGDEGAALAWLDRAGDATSAALGAEAVGVMRRMLADTIDYARARQQFGQPIARFQVLQHRMVDMRIELEMAISATCLATLKLGASPAERARAASVARVTVGEACRRVGEAAIQLHGGMGMSDAVAVTHYFRRATALASDLGSTDDHVARFIRAHAALAAAA